MKKTIVALAVLTAAGASFSQVTITGKLAMGYKQTTAPGGTADASGFGVDTSEIVFNASEDLGGGQTVAAKLGINGADRSGAPGYVNPTVAAIGAGNVTGNDASLTYTNKSFGQIQLGTFLPPAIHSGIPSAGAPVIAMDGKLFEIRTPKDYVSYTVPVGPVLVQYRLMENNAGLGLGLGSQGPAGKGAPSIGQRTSSVSLVYGAGGPLQLVGAYLSSDNRNANVAGLTTAEGVTKDSTVAFQAGYDIGVAKFGLGYNIITASVGATVTDMLVGVSVPVGAWTLGMTLGRETVAGVRDNITKFRNAAGALVPAFANAEGTANSMSWGVQYDLSKRTNVAVKYATWTRSGYEMMEQGALATGYQSNASETQLLLSHSF